MFTYSADDRSDWTEGEYLREIARLTRQRDEWNITGQSDWDSDADLAAQIDDLEDELSDRLARFDGLFLGLLDATEIEMIEAAVEAKIAAFTYEGAGGFMGLAKVRVRRLHPDMFAPITTNTKEAA